MSLTNPHHIGEIVRDNEASPYPHAGAVLIVSAHATSTAIAPAVVGWIVVRVLGPGEQQEIARRFSRRSDARAFAQAAFPNIVGWENLGSTVSAAVVRCDQPTANVDAPQAPRRRPNGLRTPLWRA